MESEALKKLEDQLNCSICLDTYTTPKLLQCNHVFCQRCLVRLVYRDQQGQLALPCPSCRQVTPVPTTGVRGLQAAFRVNKLLDTLNELWKAAENTLRCPEHLEQELKLYCETCDKLICLECIYQDHNGHSCGLVSKVFEKHCQDIRSALLPAGEQLDVASQALEMLNVRYGEIFDQQSTLEAKIRKQAQKIHRAVEDRTIELINKVHHITKEKLIDLGSQKAQIETVQAQLRSCLENIEECLDKETQAKVLGMKTALVSQVKELTSAFQTDNIFTFNIKADIKFSSLQEIVVECRNFGQVFTPSSPNSSKCYVLCKEVDQAVAEEASAVLHAINFKEEPCVKHLKSLRCELVSEMTGTRERCCTQRIRESQYQVTYRPTVKGRHQLHIKINSEHVRGSPFSVKVTSPLKMLGIPLLQMAR